MRKTTKQNSRTISCESMQMKMKLIYFLTYLRTDRYKKRLLYLLIRLRRPSSLLRGAGRWTPWSGGRLRLRSTRECVTPRAAEPCADTLRRSRVRYPWHRASITFCFCKIGMPSRSTRIRSNRHWRLPAAILWNATQAYQHLSKKDDKRIRISHSELVSPKISRVILVQKFNKTTTTKVKS